MPSFDIVSEVDLQEVRNAVDQAQRELRNRFDFKNVDAGIEFGDEGIMVRAPEEFQIDQLESILRDKLAGRKVDGRSLDAQGIEGFGKVKRQRYGLREGIDRDTAKEITKLVKNSKKLVKNSKLKVQAQVNGDKVRVTGKKRDDLQKVIAEVKELTTDVPFQFNNFRD